MGRDVADALFGDSIGQQGAALGLELQRRTAEQLFQVLGELKGGAMKVGQALSVLEPALPEEIAAKATVSMLLERRSLPKASYWMRYLPAARSSRLLAMPEVSAQVVIN